MEKLYTDAEYSALANEAMQEGKIVYKIQGLVDYDVEVYEYEKKIIQVPIYNEQGEIIGYEDKEVDDLTKPIMIEVIDPETGEKILVHKHHTETRQKMAERIEKQYKGYYICSQSNITDGTLNPDFEQEYQERERLKLDSLTLTPADVERALYKTKGMDFSDLKTLIQENVPSIDMKALSIEFRAKDFYRGATAGGVRLFDTIGAILGYSPADMDYLFIHKELPTAQAVE